MPQPNIADSLLNQDIIPVLPNRHSYFLPKIKNYDHWFMQTPILLSKRVIEINALRHAVNYLLLYHDSLRINLHFLNNELIQTIKPHDMFSDNICKFYTYKKNCDLSFKDYVETRIQNDKQNIYLPDNLLNFLVFYNTENETTLFAFLFHHVVADGYSFKILMEDLLTIYNQILQGKPVVLTKKSTPYKSFCEHSINFFKKNINEEVNYWKMMPWSKVQRLSFDYPDDISSNIEGNAESSSSSIGIDSIESFMEHFKGEGSYGLVKLLLIAIARAYEQYFNTDMLLINYTYNGRFSSDETIHLDRTVGWFSEGAPIFIPTKGSLKHLINTVESQIDRLYHDNSSYGYLKYLFHELEDDFYSAPEISFNYTPPWFAESNNAGFFAPTSEFNSHLSPSPDTQRVYLLNAKAYLTERNFILSWSYSNFLFKKSKIDAFCNNCLEEFKNIIKELVE